LAVTGSTVIREKDTDFLLLLRDFSSLATFGL